MRPPTKILFLIDHLKTGNAGTERQLHYLLEGLQRRGVECHLGVLRHSAYLEEQALPCTWSLLGRHTLASPGTWKGVHEFGREKAQEGFELVHTFFNDASILAPPMMRLAGLPTVTSRRDMGYWYTPGYLRALRCTNRWVTACVANSQAVADVTCTREWLNPERVHVIYNGLPPVPTNLKDVPELARLRAQGRILTGLVGNIRPIKRMQDLIQAIALLKDDAPALDAVLIGDGDSRALQELATNAGIGDRVHFLGPREDVPACLAQLEIGVLCSESEGFSNALVEYMRAGLPCIATNAGGNPEAIEHGRTGFLYPVGDVSALSQQLYRVAGDSSCRTALGQQARQVANEKYSIEAMTDAHCALYERVLSARDAKR